MNIRTIVTLLVALAAVGTADVASAQRGKGGDSDPAELLASDDPEKIREGIETIGLEGKPRYIEPLADRIRKGLPPELLDAAIDTLGVMGRPQAGPILFELSSHRRSEVRAKTVQAIVACKPDGAERALVTALSDEDESVRAAAALGLGEIEAKGSIDQLFTALDRGVMQAATAIGQIAEREHIDKLLGYLGELPFDTITPALLEVLAREDVPRKVKLDVIARLGELATPEVKTFLQDYVASLPPSSRGRDPVRQAAEDVILRIAE